MEMEKKVKNPQEQKSFFAKYVSVHALQVYLEWHTCLHYLQLTLSDAAARQDLAKAPYNLAYWLNWKLEKLFILPKHSVIIFFPWI